MGIGQGGETMRYAGWSSAISYQAKPGRNLADFASLIERMRAEGLNLLIVWMLSDGCYEDRYSGIDWPPVSASLRRGINKGSLNTREGTEYFSEVIKLAHENRIQVWVCLWAYGGLYNLLLPHDSWRMVNPEFERIYPFSRAIDPHPCLNAPEFRDCLRLLSSDLLVRYPEVDGFGLEEPCGGISRCSCARCRESFGSEMGVAFEDAAEWEIGYYAASKAREVIAEIVGIAKAGNRERTYFQHSNDLPGAWLRSAGVDVALQGLHGDIPRRGFREEYLGDVVVHLDVRDREPKLYEQYYHVKPKRPEMISQKFAWCCEKARQGRIAGVVAWNEAADLSAENREAAWKGLLEVRDALQ
jgi:hypothetical protein